MEQSGGQHDGSCVLDRLTLDLTRSAFLKPTKETGMTPSEFPDDLDAFTDAQRDALLAMTPEEAGRWLGFSKQGGETVQEALREIRANESN